MGGHGGHVRKEEAYQIPEKLIWYVSGLLPGKTAESGDPNPPGDCTPPPSPVDHRELEEVVQQVRLMQLRAVPSVDFVDFNPDEDDEVLELVARKLLFAKKKWPWSKLSLPHIMRLKLLL
jgi:hypothetical protein